MQRNLEIEELANFDAMQPGADRSTAIAAMYLQGATLQQIGDYFNITRERVRQVIAGTPGLSTAALRAARAERLQLERSEVRKRVQEWSSLNPTGSTGEASELFGMPESDIRKMLGPRASLHDYRKSGLEKKWPSEVLVSLLQEYADQAEAISSLDFSRWSEARGGPSHQAAVLRFRTWSGALRAAGVSTRSRSPRKQQFTNEDLWAAIIDYFRSERPRYSTTDFEQWLREFEGMPSFALIRQRLATVWGELKHEAIAVISGASDRDPWWIAEVSRHRDWSAIGNELSGAEIMRAAHAAIGDNLTQESYRAWASANGHPSLPTLRRRTSLDWRGLLQIVGLSPGRSRPGLWTKESLLTWLHAFSLENDSKSYSQYADWAALNSAPAPSLISERFGGWQEAWHHLARS